MQTSSRVLMIRPVRFGYNAETAVNNSFQQLRSTEDIHQKALIEFNNLTELLRQHDVEVLALEDIEDPHTPDSIFPNNWISFHEDGTICLYPMFAANRRMERRPAIVQELKDSFAISKTIDLTPYETAGKFLEGTGSMVLDRDNRIAYACISERTNAEVLDTFCREMNHKAIIFHAADDKGRPVYHTNVMMCVADEYVVICFDSISDENEKQILKRSFADTGKQVIGISMEQMNSFAGNMLQVCNKKGEKLLLMSSKAYASLNINQLNLLGCFNKLIHCNLDTIETNGGGSARCMLAEIFSESV